MIIRVTLPAHLRKLAQVEREVKLAVTGEVTQRAVLDALEASYPMLRGTMRDHVTKKRRAFVRFFACQEVLCSMNLRMPAARSRWRRVRNPSWSWELLRAVSLAGSR